MTKNIYLTAIINIKNIFQIHMNFTKEYYTHTHIKFLFFHKIAKSMIPREGGGSYVPHFANLRSRFHNIGCDAVEKQEYESHHEQIINRTNVWNFKEIGEQRIPLEKLLNWQHIFFAGFSAGISEMYQYIVNAQSYILSKSFIVSF